MEKEEQFGMSRVNMLPIGEISFGERFHLKRRFAILSL